MPVQKLHHVVYRCNDAKETADFYVNLLELKYAIAVSEDNVPSTGEAMPYFHLFLEMGDGSHVAFFEVPSCAPMQKDPNTPEWVQHLALEVESMDELERMRKKLDDAGVELVGPTDHGFCQSIYFFDPNGHRLELTYQNGDDAMMQKLRDTAEPMLTEWTKSKTTQKHAAWVHEKAWEQVEVEPAE
ncbi:MAG: VOC family protein [Proteobacteria bacterium]|nr:VOC family protein [Pseudomonadota bacterium]